MHKYLKKFAFLLLFFYNFLYCGIVDAIAIIVNDNPITLLEIDAKIKNTALQTQEAVNKIIDDVLYKESLRKNDIQVHEDEVQSYLKKIADFKKTSLEEIKENLLENNQSYENFTQQIHEQLLYEKFLNKLIRSNIKFPNENDLKIYYDNNLYKFQKAYSFDIIQYAANTKEALDLFRTSKMISKNIEQTRFRLEASKINPQLTSMLNTTSEKNFTDILIANQKFVLLFIDKKNDITQANFENSKDEAFEMIMKEREESLLKEFFNKMRINASIKVLR